MPALMFAREILVIALLTAVILLWARSSKLDLGLRAPTLSGVWPWILLFILWCGLVTAVDAVRPRKIDEELLEWLRQHSFIQIIVLGVVLLPLFEELLFRGVLFSALFRASGLKVAIAVPSVIWALAHLQYEAWYMVSIAGSGVVLAMIRWKSGSLYPPLALHAAFNLFVALTEDLGPQVA